MSSLQAKTNWFQFILTNDQISKGKHFELLDEFEKTSQGSSLSGAALYFHRNLKDSFTTFFISLGLDQCRNASHIILGFNAVPCREPDLKYLIPISRQS